MDATAPSDPDQRAALQLAELRDILAAAIPDAAEQSAHVEQLAVTLQLLARPLLPAPGARPFRHTGQKDSDTTLQGLQRWAMEGARRRATLSATDIGRLALTGLMRAHMPDADQLRHIADHAAWALEATPALTEPPSRGQPLNQPAHAIGLELLYGMTRLGTWNPRMEGAIRGFAPLLRAVFAADQPHGRQKRATGVTGRGTGGARM
jgi:hypothetical protein